MFSPRKKHPAIIARFSRYSALVIDQAHRRTLHSGTQLTLAVVRQRYWIIGGRELVGTIIKDCITCARNRGARAQQLMGQLPRRRITLAKPFEQSGVDFAGPFHLLRWRGPGTRSYNGYISVFVCLTTTAIHLEVVTDYTPDGFIAAYKRFSGRRGIPPSISSDRGTNFIAADRILERWKYPRADTRVGSVVLTADERFPPCMWPLARVTATHPGPDGLIRVVDLRTATVNLQRPMHKICLLPIDTGDDEEAEPGHQQ